MIEFFAAVLFILASIFQFQTSPMDSFVLALISALYFKGLISRKGSYVIVASLIAVIFAVLTTLVIFADYANSIISGEEFKFKLELGILGYVGLVFLKLRHRYVQGKVV